MKIIRGSTRRCYGRIVISFLVAVVLTAGMVGCMGGGGGDGDDLPPSENLEIRTWYDLDDVRDNLAGNHTLMNDLDCTTSGYEELAGPTANQGRGWDPIGNCTPMELWVVCYGLTGSLDGQGHEIRDLFTNRPDSKRGGVFEYLGDGGVVKNLGVVNVTVVGENCVGGLIGMNEGGIVSNCYSSGNVTGDVIVGGLVGHLDGNAGKIVNCYSSGSVVGNADIGGLVGQLHTGCTISNCYSTCNVTDASPGSGDVGGLVGYGYDVTVSNSFWDIETSGQATSVGGTGKNTTEMQDITTFSGAGWNIIAVALNETDPSYIWNIVNGLTYPFLSWQP